MGDLDLARRFVRARGPTRSAPDLARLQQILEQAWREGQARWPAVRVSPGELAEHLARIASHDRDPARAVEQVHCADAYLAHACARGDAAGLVALDELLTEAVLRTTSSAHRDDVGQAVRERLLVATDGPPRIAEYRGRGRLSSWLRVCVARAEVDAIRAAEAEERAQAGWHDTVHSETTPELDYLKQRYRDDFADALRESVDRLSSRHRNVLRQKLLLSMSVARMAELHRVTDRTIKRWLAAARAALFERTRAALMRRLEISTREFDSIIRLLDSQMDVSVRRLL